ncbi:MAG: hypothetical protein C4293_02700 [Nitrospiraceae bacterium]
MAYCSRSGPDRTGPRRMTLRKCNDALGFDIMQVKAALERDPDKSHPAANPEHVAEPPVKSAAA